MENVEITKVNYKGIRIVIKNTDYEFSYFTTKHKSKLIIIDGTKCIDKSEILHKAIKIYK